MKTDLAGLRFDLPRAGQRRIVGTEMVCSDCGTTWHSRIADLIVAHSRIARCARCGGKLIAPQVPAATQHDGEAEQPPHASAV